MSEQTIAAVAAGNPYLKVIIIDDESDSIPEVLGITKERELELDKLIQECGEREKTITDIFASVSKSVRHANELAYCIFHVGSHMGRSKIIRELANHGLKNFLSDENED